MDRFVFFILSLEFVCEKTEKNSYPLRVSAFSILTHQISDNLYIFSLKKRYFF